MAISKGLISLKSNFQLSIGGITGYQLNLPASDFKLDKHHKETFYRYENRDVRVWLESSGRFEVEIKKADLSAIDPALLSYVGLSVDTVFSDARSKLKCYDEFCSINGHYRHHERDRDQDHDKSHDDWRWEHK